MRLGPLDRVRARTRGVAVGLRARLTRVVGGVPLDVGGGRLGDLEDALHLGAGARSERLARAAFQRVTQLLDVGRERPQVRVHRRGVITPTTDRKVALLDALAVSPMLAILDAPAVPLPHHRGLDRRLRPRHLQP